MKYSLSIKYKNFKSKCYKCNNKTKRNLLIEYFNDTQNLYYLVNEKPICKKCFKEKQEKVLNNNAFIEYYTETLGKRIQLIKITIICWLYKNLTRYYYK